MSTAVKPQPSTHGAPADSRRFGWILFAAGILAGAAVSGLFFYERGARAAHGARDAQEKASTARASEVPVEVETVRLSKGGIVRSSVQIGSVTPFEEADLYAKVSGYLSALHVDYGDRVKRDQLLAEIDDPEVVEDAKKAAADVLQAKAAVAQAEAFIESAKADRDAAATTIEQASAEVGRYVATRKYVELKVARYKDLVSKNALPQQVADEEEENLGSARASELASQKAVLNARAQFTAANARVEKAKADLAEAKANVEIAQAKRGRADVLVGYCKIYSPYDGVITRRNMFRGAFIRSAAEGGVLPLLTVARVDKVRVITQVPERYVPFTNVGDPAEVTLDALGAEIFKGKVSRLADREDPTSRTMHTEIDLPNPDGRLTPGMYGIAKIILDTDTKASTLPASCLVGDAKEGKASVYVVDNGKAKKAAVEIGADDGLRVEILSGLSADDDVIMKTGAVTEGSAVRIAPKTEDAIARLKEK